MCFSQIQQRKAAVQPKRINRRGLMPAPLTFIYLFLIKRQRDQLFLLDSLEESDRLVENGRGGRIHSLLGFGDRSPDGGAQKASEWRAANP